MRVRVFHHLDVIRQLATRVIRMESGQVVASGAAASADLSDPGRLAAGLRADLALVDDAGSWPVVPGHVPRP